MHLSLLDNQFQWALSFIVNIALISFAQRYPLLTKNGWLHAGILGTILWGCLGWQGWCSVVIYLFLGSLVTKIGFNSKQSKGLAEARGGSRGPENVWGSAATGAMLAILFKSLNGIGDYFILIAFASSFCAKLADTFGSELGKRYGTKTYLITSFTLVPPGTDGGVSVEGTIASFMGSFVMAIVMMLFRFIPSQTAFLIVLFSGFAATLFESLFGSLYQHRIKGMTNELVNFIQTSFASILSILLAFIFRF